MRIWIVKRDFFWFTRNIWTVCYDVSKGVNYDKDRSFIRVIQNRDGIKQAIDKLDGSKLKRGNKDLTKIKL